LKSELLKSESEIYNLNLKSESEFEI